MSNNPLLQGARGERHLLLGNEAIVRGALEAGVHMVSCYPGTPSSEVPDTFHRLGGEGRYRLEYSVNEKVAMEVAAGAALGGAMSLVTMKHVGVNVAADPMFTSAYTGLPGGMVVLTADDPGCHSSQNEQDNRTYARFAQLPCFEPASAQEAKDMTREAFRLARELQQPVMLRTTTRISHLRGAVDFDDLPAAQPKVEFKRDPGRFVPVPAVARKRHVALDGIIEKARQFAESSRFNTVREPQTPTRLGIITSGVARDYLSDALAVGGWGDRVRVLELGMTWPLPTGMITEFLHGCDRVLVLEEGVDLLEQDIRAMVQKHDIRVRIEGKDAGLTGQGEYSTTLVMRRISSWLDTPCPAKPVRSVDLELPGRPPNLCAGCSHRAVYYAARQVFGDDAYYSSDIGCYTLGLLPPLRTADFLVCMGSSVSAGSGFARASGKPVVAFIGDSTFFHSGMTGLANAVFNQHDIILVILDNGTTAMTGHQPNPGMIQDMLGSMSQHMDIEAIVRAMGVTQCAKVRSFNVKAVAKALEEMKAQTGVRVLITEEPCVLYARRQLKKAQPQVAEVAQQGPEAMRCLEQLACPAFYREGDNLAVDATLCTGCMVCLQVAPTAFKARKR
ncbi:indolepyruvate ferredoxin oxidoreductase subunit alpha [Desulfovibrio desulfuricans]|uniref:Indolepyruvate oxidoreductase subunit IorA n=1 Tax=Desulfovibrio desulfuricans TaxID=876 RepID=A0A4P7UJ02_DESDE|nr:indolepyruvate ferredoxin oxidoreductase subunit alpha [Desulfovibrio desulfuricans]QCC84668.1 indolepyruvate ferredoxin oxidoreductase subunit alpha [Desulfovibrio desulfuricans]